MDYSVLEANAAAIRRKIIEMCYYAGPARKAHPGPALSLADIIAVLYFKHMKLDPHNPEMHDRDRLVLSKGHACPVIYAALCEKGYFDRNELLSLRRINGMLQGHPDMKGTPGIDMTAGSLGNGLSAGVGMAMAAKMDGLDYKTYVIIGDGESQEGMIWEAAMSAPALRLDNLIVILDNNGFQSCGATNEILSIEPVSEKWRAFKWKTLEIDGHSIDQIDRAVIEANRVKDGKPTIIIAETIKGKGVSFMENDNSWHQQSISDEQYEIAMKELQSN